MLFISADAAPGRKVTVKHLAGNIRLINGRDYVMDADGKQLQLLWSPPASEWWEVSRGFTSIADLVDTAEAIPYSLSPVVLGGALSVKAYETSVYCPHAFTIKSVTGILNTGPTEGPCIIDVRDNGNSIFNNQAAMVNVADGTTQKTSAVVNHAVDAGNVLTFEVEEVNGSPADATLVINGFVSPKTPPV